MKKQTNAIIYKYLTEKKKQSITIHLLHHCRNKDLLHQRDQHLHHHILPKKDKNTNRKLAIEFAFTGSSSSSSFS